MRTVLLCAVLLIGACGDAQGAAVPDGALGDSAAAQSDAQQLDAETDSSSSNDAGDASSGAGGAGGNGGSGGTAGNGGTGGVSGSGGASGSSGASGTGGTGGSSGTGGTGGNQPAPVWTFHSERTGALPHELASETYETYLRLAFETVIPGCDVDDDFGVSILKLGRESFTFGYVGEHSTPITELDRSCLGHGATAAATVWLGSVENGVAGTFYNAPATRPGPTGLPSGLVLWHRVDRFVQTSTGVEIDETWELRPSDQ